MATRTWRLLFVALVASGCVSRGGGDDDASEAQRSLTPTFAPADDLATSTTGVSSSTAAPGPPATTARDGGPDPAGPTGTPGEVPVLTAAITDPSGDLTLSPLDPPPRWADLRGATLQRTGEGYEVSISFGDPAPERSSDGEHTMNVASFYDVDGDGQVDVEVWANLADTGWGPAVYDDRGGHFGTASGVVVQRDGGRLVLRFPLSTLGGADRFRWSVASEWGRYDVIGTDLAARDDLPDGDQPAPFPG